MSGSARLPYGCLAVRRVRGGVLHKADGTTQLFEEYDKAVEARQTWIAEELLPRAAEVVRQARESFVRGCTIKGRSGRHSGASAYEVWRDIYSPGGELLESIKLGLLVPDEAVAGRIAAHANTRFPEPSVESLRADSKTTVTETVVWSVGLYLNGSYSRLPAFDSWSFSFPVEGVLHLLNELAADGWAVAQVSEDRGLVRSQTNPTDSVVTTARYLLVREFRPCGAGTEPGPRAPH